jgi:hypothetical protein
MTVYTNFPKHCSTFTQLPKQSTNNQNIHNHPHVIDLSEENPPVELNSEQLSVNEPTVELLIDEPPIELNSTEALRCPLERDSGEYTSEIPQQNNTTQQNSPAQQNNATQQNSPAQLNTPTQQNSPAQLNTPTQLNSATQENNSAITQQSTHSKAALALSAAMSKLQHELNINAASHPLNTAGIKFPHQVQSNKYLSWLSQFQSTQHLQEAQAQIDILKRGNYSVLPRICPGLQSCLHAHICPFADSQNTPNNLQCPMEQAFVSSKIESYMAEHNVSTFTSSQFTLINRLTELDLSEFRLSSLLASPQFQNPVWSQPTGSTSKGTILFQDVISPIYEVQEKISRERLKLLQILVATPEAVYKKQAALKQIESDTYAKQISNLSRQVAEFSQIINKKKDNP